MKILRTVGLIVLAAAAPFAIANSDAGAKRSLDLATANLEKGSSILAGDSRAATNAVRLQTLDRALWFLRRSRTVSIAGDTRFDAVRTDASRLAVRALGEEAEIYYRRKSLPLAGKRVDEALALDPTDSRARNLNAMIEAAKSTDVYSADVGGVAVDRIRERRAASGVPLRDRGISRRR